MRVYCSECRYHRRVHFCSFCEYKKTISTPIYREAEIEPFNPEKQNKNNDCDLFEKKVGFWEGLLKGGRSE